jgi:tungstate transport system substrate-binding protein
MLAALTAAALLACVPAAAARDLRLATTTSTENSGLLRAILPKFEAKFHVAVHVIAVGTGKALKLGENGDADVLLVHAPAAELAFMKAGHGVDRRAVMHNDFIVVGPAADPAKVHGTTDVIGAFRRIAESKSKFISRGDDSGTDKMEKSYWPEAGPSPAGQAWYVSAGQGMGEVLTMASELQGYTLTDRGTYAAYRAKSGLQIHVQGDPRMFNPYHVISVNPAKYPDINYRGATDFSDWITSPEGQQAIADYKIEGEELFFPDAGTAASH